MWNYVGRESTVQDAGVDLSELLAIPLIIGLFGLFYHYQKDWKMATVFLIMFIFLGYLPRKASARRALIESLADEPRTLVLFEVPHRIEKTMVDLIAVLGEDRLAAVGRELTKLHEEIVRGTLREIEARLASGEPRGEYTIVLSGAPSPVKWTKRAVKEAVLARIDTGVNRSSAARQIAAESGWDRQEIYRLSLEEG